MPEPTPSTEPRPPRKPFRARVLDVQTVAEIAHEIERTDTDPEGIGIMTRKARIYPIRIEAVSLKASPILKQELLAVGGDAAHSRGIADHSVSEGPVVLLATLGQYHRLLPKLGRQPFRLAEIAVEIERALKGFTRRAPAKVAGVHRSFSVGGRPLVMGVVNVTPDSFSDGGRFLAPADAIAHGLLLQSEGADLLDIGGESTRPGATPVSIDEEWKRIGPVLSALHEKATVPISVDTRRAEVARRAIDAGADLVNDVGTLSDPEMRRVIRETGAPVIAMHMRGTPTTMQQELNYGDLRGEVFDALASATERAVAEGIPPDRLLIDPGLGFGKSAPQSLELLAHVAEFRSLGFPVVVGASRKSFLGAALGNAPVGERLEAGLAAAVLAAEHGAAIVRVHDVAPTVRALRFVEAVRVARPVHDGTGDVSLPTD